MKCDVCDGAGELGPLPCGRCDGKGRTFSYAAFDLLAIFLVLAGVAGAIGYTVVINRDAPRVEEAQPRTGTLYHRVPR